MVQPADITALYETAQFGKLEPLAGFSLALNLAYLNLQRWRYKEQVKSIAKKALDELHESNPQGSNHTGLNQFNSLMYLTGDAHKWRKLPVFLQVFDIIFGKETDIKLSATFTVCAFIILATGVMHQIHIGRFLLPLATYGGTQIGFWILISSLGIPVAFVWGGRKFVERMTGFAKECADEIASIYVNKIDEVALPENGSAA